MQWLNYHHLFYFWLVVREGGVSRACAKLRLAQPTVSAQLRSLEEQLGEVLFERRGRRLILTEVGHLVYRYAEEIFPLGQELLDAVKGNYAGKPLRVSVGLVDVLPKLVAYRLIEPVYRMHTQVHVVCEEDRPDRLLVDLGSHRLDVVLTDTPVSWDEGTRFFTYLLLDSGVSFLGNDELTERLSPGFPSSLDGAPFLATPSNTSLRRSVDSWLDSHGIRPRVVGEFADSALLKVFGRAGVGVFATPSVTEPDLLGEYGLRVVGRADLIRERFYAVTTERRLRNPGVAAMIDAARSITPTAPVRASDGLGRPDHRRI